MSAGSIGVPNVILIGTGAAKGGMRGMKLNGAGRPSGISLSNPVGVGWLVSIGVVRGAEGRGGGGGEMRGRGERKGREEEEEEEGEEEGDVPVIHIGIIVGGRGVSMMIRPLER